MILDDIARSYEFAEVTLVLAHLRSQNRCVLVFGVIELCPVGQPKSPEIKSGGFPQHRKALGSGITLYLKRLFVTPERALQIFRNPECEPSTLRDLLVQLEGPHYIFPEGEEPLLLEPNGFDETTLGAMLPRRATCLRVVSKFDTKGATLALFNHTRQQSMFAELKEVLGIDLARFQEHVGALHICFSNPIVSRFDVRLSADQKHLLLSVTERPGKSISGSLVELANQLPLGQGFSILHPLDTRYSVIPLPTDPAALQLRLFDSSRSCIESHPAATFIRGFSISTSSITKIPVVITLPDGSTQTTITEVADPINPRGQPEERPPSPVEYIRDANARRELEDLRKNKVFMFFSGKGASRADALEALRGLIRQARRRVTVIDAYLCIDDVTTLLESFCKAACPVRLLAADGKLSRKGNDTVAVETRLAAGLDLLVSQLAFPIDAKKMPGDGAHDRWLQIDDQIYALGSSINHFGERATMLYRLPHPQEIEAEIEEWWTNARSLNLAHPSSVPAPGDLAESISLGAEHEPEEPAEEGGRL